ncbi:MAG: hypothetical protein JNN07_04650 [Verrucomicrobiales bacterium]|nr:hypothetical protein [Verrucomicrobiales bacterium]
MKSSALSSLTLVLGLSGLVPFQQVQAKVDFTKEVKPILEQSCVKCHGAEKQKGKLRLDSKEAAFKKEGIIVPGNADKSDLLHRVTLPKGHDDAMPPEGDPLPKAQVDVLRAWLTEGAEWPAGVTIGGGATAPAKPKTGVEALGEHKPEPAELQAIEKLQAAGITVMPVAMNQNWRDANLSLLGTNVTDSTLAQFKDIKGLVHLNLRNTKITDAGLANLKGLGNLISLNLSGTAVTDAGLAHLKGLAKLEYLNLYNTAVGDAGLANLKELKNLKALYLWQSKATDAGVAELQKSLPGLKPNRGIDMTVLAKKEEKKEEKKDEKKEEKK